MKRFLNGHGVLLFVFIYAILFAFIEEKFISLQNLQTISVQIVPVAILAIAVSMVLIIGGIDLTSGIGVSLAAVTIEYMIRNTDNLILALTVSLVACVLLGVINGFFVGILNIESIMFTLINMTIVFGVVQIITKASVPLNLMNPFFDLINNTMIAELIPLQFLILIIIMCVTNIILQNTKFGVQTLAIGGNLNSSISVGINVKKIKFFVFVVTGFYIWITSVFLVAKVAYVMPSIGGIPLFLDALAASLIGGVSITGGKAKVLGIFYGALLITIVNNSVNLLEIHPNWNNFAKGVIIILMLIINNPNKGDKT